MITALSESLLESAFRAYIVARFTADEITVPTPSGEGTVADAAPEVIAATAGTTVSPTKPYVAVLVSEMKADAVGVYAEALRVQVIAVAPFPYPPGIDVDDHSALAAAVAAIFPARPRHGSATYEDDLETWQELHDSLGEQIEEIAGYSLGGWVIEGSRTSRTQAGTIETALTIRPCCFHADHAG